MSDLHRFNSLKILAYPQMRQAARDEYPFPIDWHIYPSNLCNHHCSWCIFIQNGEQNIKEQLPLDLMLRAIDDAADTGATLVNFQGGGEPLVNRHTLDAMRHVNAKGMRCALSTNGRLLTPAIAACVDYLRISLNAGTEDQHFRTNHNGQGKSDWPHILEAIAASIPHRRGDVGLSFALDHNNYRDVFAFCQLAADIGVDFVHIRPVFYYDAADDARVRAVMPAALALCDAARHAFGDRLRIFAITEKFDGYWTPRQYTKCRAIQTGVVLTASGEFAVCLDRMDLRFGHGYKRGQSFRDIWGSPEHRAVAEQVVAPGELDRCPRCVWNKRNDIIEQVFGPADAMRLAMP